MGRTTLTQRSVFGGASTSIAVTRAFPRGEDRAGPRMGRVLFGLFLSAAACGRTNVALTARSDAVPPADAPVCIDIDRASYDTSCRTNSDCILINTGRICAGYNCLCGNAAINVASQPKYEATFNAIPRSTGVLCQCPAQDRPRCIRGSCVLCPYPPKPGVGALGCSDAD